MSNLRDHGLHSKTSVVTAEDVAAFQASRGPAAAYVAQVQAEQKAITAPGSLLTSALVWMVLGGVLLWMGNAPQGIGSLITACYCAICARIAQANNHHREIVQLLHRRNG